MAKMSGFTLYTVLSLLNTIPLKLREATDDVKEKG